MGQSHAHDLPLEPIQEGFGAPVWSPPEPRRLFHLQNQRQGLQANRKIYELIFYSRSESIVTDHHQPREGGSVRLLPWDIGKGLSVLFMVIVEVQQLGYP